MELSGSRRFSTVEQPQTHVNLHPMPGSVCCTTVQTCLEVLNHPKLVRNYLMILGPSEAEWFKEVWRVEPPRTQVMIYPRHGSMCCTMVRTGLEELNYPNFMRYYSMILVPSWTVLFKEARKGWPFRNSWEIILWSLFQYITEGTRLVGKILITSSWFDCPVPYGTSIEHVYHWGNKASAEDSHQFEFVWLSQTSLNQYSTSISQREQG